MNWGNVFGTPNASASAMFGSQRNPETCRAINSVGLECHVDIVEVTGSSPVSPI